MLALILARLNPSLAEPKIATGRHELGALQASFECLRPTASEDPAIRVVKPNSEEPDAVVPHVRICGGPVRGALPGRSTRSPTPDVLVGELETSVLGGTPRRRLRATGDPFRLRGPDRSPCEHRFASTGR